MVRQESRVLTAWLFTVLAVSGVWIGTSLLMAGVWAVVVAIAALAAAQSGVRFEAPAGPLEIKRKDIVAAVFASLPAFLYLAATWRQEFPYHGDQAHHNGYALEASGFWWPWLWMVAVAAIAAVVRWASPRLAVIAVALLPVAGLITGGPYAFAGQYPGTLPFVAAPWLALADVHPLNVERTLNALAIPAWLLILRPLFLRRPATMGTAATAALLFWQTDVVYYFTSGYIEAWAVVLVLTALEHLILFDGEAVWRPLLLLGTAAMVKEHVVIALPVVALVYCPGRERMRHVVVALTALAPFALFFCLRATFKSWSGVTPSTSAWTAGHLAAYGHRVSLQFGAALPVVVVAVMALIVLARRRAFAAVLLVAAADAVFFFTAPVQRPWTGYPRTNLVPLACAALALGALVERLPRVWRALAVAAVVVCNLIPLVPAMRAAFGPDTARNFFEHGDAPMFFPIRQALARGEREGLIRAGDEVRLLNNGKRVFDLFYPGPIEDQYPDLARRYRLRVMSFRDDPARCGCTSPDAAQLAVFIAFSNLGAAMPQRAAIEEEAARCRAAMAATCKRVIALDHAMIGR